MPPLILLFIALLLLLALYLLITGLRLRRIGSEPHCRKCNYILLHLTSSRCPECGTTISPENTLIGQPHRCWKRAITGIVLMILACLPTISLLRNINWYHYKPAGFVLADLDAPGVFGSTFDKAMKELRRRDSAGTLPESVRQKLIEKALREQAAATVSPYRWDLQEYLSEAVIHERLTQPQLKRFLDQAVILTVTARPIVAEGDQVPINIWIEYRVRTPHGPSPLMLWYQYEKPSCKVDGEVIYFPISGGNSPFSFGRGVTGSSRPAGTVGKHVIETESIWIIYCQTEHSIFGKGYGKSRELGTCTCTAKTTYEVVPRELAPQIELLDTPELRKEVAAAIRLEKLSWQKGHPPAGDSLLPYFRLDKLPCNVAFDVFIKIDQEEIKTRSFHCAKGKGTFDFYYLDYAIKQLPAQLPAKVNVILRPSVERAKNTVDMNAIYSGEIEFMDVPVEQSPN